MIVSERLLWTLFTNILGLWFWKVLPFIHSELGAHRAGPGPSEYGPDVSCSGPISGAHRLAARAAAFLGASESTTASGPNFLNVPTHSFPACSCNLATRPGANSSHNAHRQPDRPQVRLAELLSSLSSHPLPSMNL
jgi:hypothetical protein